jgi:hypothetical protein
MSEITYRTRQAGQTAERFRRMKEYILAGITVLFACREMYKDHLHRFFTSEKIEVEITIWVKEEHEEPVWSYDGFESYISEYETIPEKFLGYIIKKK